MELLHPDFSPAAAGSQPSEQVPLVTAAPSKAAAPQLRPDVWQFAAGRWSPIPEPFDFGAERAGYWCSGEDWQTVQLFEAIEATPTTTRWNFVVQVSPYHDHTYLVLVPDLPDLLRLMPLLAPWMQQDHTEVFQDTVWSFCRQMFHAQHGHGLDAYCDRCAPEVMRRYRERRCRKGVGR